MIHISHFMRRPEPGANSVERLFEDVRAHLPADIQVGLCTSRFHSRGLFRRLYDILRARGHQGDVNHVTGDVHFLTYLLDRHRTILTILDCVMLERLNGISRWLLWLLWYWLPEKRCAVITVISEATRQQVLQYLHCDPEKIHVIHCNVSGEFQPTPKTFNAARPRLLQIGTNTNKNLERVAEALEGLECELTIIGRLTAGQIDVLKHYDVSYENLVDLSREELVEQYQRCDMVIFASTYEFWPAHRGSQRGRAAGSDQHPLVHARNRRRSRLRGGSLRCGQHPRGDLPRDPGCRLQGSLGGIGLREREALSNRGQS